MSSMCRFASRFICNSSRKTTVLSHPVVRTTSSDTQSLQTEPIKTENHVYFAGIVLNSSPPTLRLRSPMIKIQHFSNFGIKVVGQLKLPEVVEKLKIVEPGMNVAVEGYLGQRLAIKKVDDAYYNVRESFIVAEKVEILKTEEDVQRKNKERIERIMSEGRSKKGKDVPE